MPISNKVGEDENLEIVYREPLAHLSEEEFIALSTDQKEVVTNINKLYALAPILLESTAELQEKLKAIEDNALLYYLLESIDITVLNDDNLWGSSSTIVFNNGDLNYMLRDIVDLVKTHRNTNDFLYKFQRKKAETSDTKSLKYIAKIIKKLKKGEVRSFLEIEAEKMFQTMLEECKTSNTKENNKDINQAIKEIKYNKKHLHKYFSLKQFLEKNKAILKKAGFWDVQIESIKKAIGSKHEKHMQLGKELRESQQRGIVEQPST